MSGSILQIDTSIAAGIAFEGGYQGINNNRTPVGSANRPGRAVQVDYEHNIVGLDAVGGDLDKFIRAHTPGRNNNNNNKNNVTGDNNSNAFDDLSTLTSGDINSGYGYNRVTGDSRLPKIGSTAGRSGNKYDNINAGHSSMSPLAEDQTIGMRNLNTSFKEDKEKKDVSAMFARAVSNLPQEKATSLLHALAELETTLRLEGVARVDEYGERIRYDYGIGLADDHHLHSPTIARGGGDMISVAGSVVSNMSLSSSTSSLFGTESVMSRYSIDKKYGKTNRSDAKEIHFVLKKIGEAMHVNQEDFKLLGYDLTGRGTRPELLGPTLLSQRLLSEIKLSLSTKEVTLMMKKFDVDNRGVVDITAVLGSAKSVYESHINHMLAKKSDKKKEYDRKLLLKQRADYKDKTESSEAIDDAIHVILGKLRNYAFEAMRKRNMKVLHDCKRVIDVPAFHTLLFDLGVILSSRQIRILMKRYNIGQTNTVDTSLFKKEFIALGQDMLREIRKAEAVQIFIDTLSKGKQPVEIERKKLQEKEKIKGGGKDTGIPSSKIGGERMTLAKAEIWLADPLTVPVTGTKNKNQQLQQAMQLTNGIVSNSNNPNPNLKSPRSAEQAATNGIGGRSIRIAADQPANIVSSNPNPNPNPMIKPRSADQQNLILPAALSKPPSRGDSRPESSQHNTTHISKPRTAEALRGRNVVQNPDIFEEVSYAGEISLKSR